MTSFIPDTYNKPPYFLQQPSNVFLVQQSQEYNYYLIWFTIFQQYIKVEQRECAEERREAQKDLSSWRNALEKRGMKVSRSKTEYMCCNGNSEGELKIGEEAIPTVKEFKYLGSTVESAGGVDSEVNRRTQAEWNNWRKMSDILCDKVPNRVKSKILKTVVQPAMLFSIGTEQEA